VLNAVATCRGIAELLGVPILAMHKKAASLPAEVDMPAADDAV
jgi:hypothetical protein